MTITEALVGKRIKKYELEGKGHYIRFFFDDETELTLGAVENSCSQTWIESVDCPALLSGLVLSVEDLEMPDLGDVKSKVHGDADIVAYYGLMIKTENGTVVLDYRNDSNGYYGGSLYVVGG